MDPAYRERYRALHAQHWWWRARETAVDRMIEREVKPRLSVGQARILEIGAGSGLNFPLLSSLGSISGVEMDAGWQHDPEAQKYDLRFGDFLALEFAAQRFDLVVALDVIEHIPDDVAAMNKIWRLLNERGLLLINVPAWNALWTRHDDLNHHVRRYAPRQLEQLASQCGFRLLRVQSLFLWTALAKLLVALRERGMKTAHEAEDDLPGIPSALPNRLLTHWSELENRALAHLPAGAGSSLLALFERA